MHPSIIEAFVKKYLQVITGLDYGKVPISGYTITHFKEDADLHGYDKAYIVRIDEEVKSLYQRVDNLEFAVAIKERPNLVDIDIYDTDYQASPDKNDIFNNPVAYAFPFDKSPFLTDDWHGTDRESLLFVTEYVIDKVGLWGYKIPSIDDFTYLEIDGYYYYIAYTTLHGCSLGGKSKSTDIRITKCDDYVNDVFFIESPDFDLMTIDAEMVYRMLRNKAYYNC